jgi:Response regulators consisting of a CheY-like receiver domain and a winged-helix DNA-binding domain
LNKFPISIYSIIEKININLLKQKYLEQSDIFIGKYSVDLNLRLIKINTNKLKLTEREIQIIIFLNNSKTPQNIQKLQKEVWGYNSPLETHTVETHIYRLRKKILEKFADNNFIVSTKQGYKI